jgi:hypothetical protein
MDNLLNFAFGGIYSILILSLTFNFALALKLRGMNKDINTKQAHAKEQTELLKRRLIKVRDDLMET